MATSMVADPSSTSVVKPRPRSNLVGSMFASAAVLMLLAGMLALYLHERAAVVSTGGTWIPEDATLPLTQPNVMMLGLLMASVSVQWAVQAARNDDRLNFMLATGLTIVLGAAYVNMAVFLYSQMGLVLAFPDSPAPVLIYAITGTHLAMVVAATVFVALAALRALRAPSVAHRSSGLSAAAVYWHATVLAFFVIWLSIYVTK